MAEQGTPPLVCAFALGRGRYCIRRYNHDGDHMPSRRAAWKATARAAHTTETEEHDR